MGQNVQVSSAIRDARTATRWTENSQRLYPNWWDSSLLRQYVSEQICGEPREDGVAEALRRTVQCPLNRAVSIGCGDARKELLLLQGGAVLSFDLYDIAPGQVAVGEAAIMNANMAERAVYLSTTPLSEAPKPIYDLIYWDHSLHHMFDVRAALLWCRQSPAPNGVICVNDYVGPTRLQWTATETARANQALVDLGTKHGVTIPKIKRGNPLKRFRQYLSDPSEAPQSDRIEAACSEVFPNFELRPLGGAALNMGGGQVMSLADPSPALLRDFAKADKQLLHEGIYHFAFGIWQNKPY